jgi:hypothetical protein
MKHIRATSPPKYATCGIYIYIAKTNLAQHYKKISFCHFHLSVHVANKWPHVWSVLDPGVAKYIFGRVYSNTRVHCAMCTVIHVADSLPRVS